MPKTRILSVLLAIMCLAILTACGRGSKAGDTLTTIDSKLSNVVAKGADPAKYYGVKLALHHVEGGELPPEALSFSSFSDERGFDLTIAVKDAAEFSGLYLSVEYADDSIAPLDITPGGFLGEDQLFLAMLDRLNEVPIAASKINDGKTSGSGEICTIRFAAKGTVRTLMDDLARPWKVFAPGLEEPKSH